MTAAVVTAVAGVAPAAEIGNDWFAERLDTDDAWITSRTGIRARRWAGVGVSTGDLAVAAGRAALERHTRTGGAGVDTLVLATTTPDWICPGTAPAVAARLGLGHAAAFDVGAACSGFVYGLATAAGLLHSGVARRILLICSETLSRITDTQDRDTAILFGDGAAALVLEAGEAGQDGEVLAFDLGADGTGSDLLSVPAGGSRRPFDAEALFDRAAFLRMDGRAVYRHAVERMTASARTCLERAQVCPGDLRHLVGHQANARILAAVADRVGVTASQHFSNIARFGNTSAASIPLALCDLAEQRAPAAGDLVLTTAFGGGFTWGSALLRWPGTDRIAPISDYDDKEHAAWTTCSSR